MAIIQISKIQQRTGNLVDLPQLDEAEFGWATDAKRLFIGKSVPNENVEVLTSYSNISFSQVTGAGGSNLNIVAPLNGQVLSYVSSTNTWQNSGSTGGGLINLGTVSNVKLSGGAIGYVLQTDGTGNLTWASKGTITANIVALSNATPIVMQVATSIPYTNGTAITISGVNGTANSNVNSKIFYVKVATDFPTSGNVTLYTDSVLSTAAVGTSLTYTNSPNALAITAVGGGGATSANGSTYSVQFNNSGIISGDSNITWDFNNRIFSVNGNANITGNINATANIIGSRLVSNIATGTAPLVVTSTTQVANLNVATAGLATFATTANAVAGANVSGTVANATSATNAAALLTTLTTTGTAYIPFISGTATGNYAHLSNANFSANLANGYITATGFVGTLSGAATTAGTVTTAAQGNITSVGLLTGLTVGNATANSVFGNGTITLNAGLITGNGAGLSQLAGGNITGQVGNALVAGTVYTNAQPNITSVGTLTSLSVSGNVTGANLVGPLAAGNSNITITTDSNISMYVNGNANVRLTVTDTGANVTGTFTSTGNISGPYVNASEWVLASAFLFGNSNRNANFNVLNANTSRAAGIKSFSVTYTDPGTGGITAMGAINSLAAPTVQGITAATVYTNLATLYVANAPTIGSSITVSNNWALYVGGGRSYFGGNITSNGQISATGTIIGGSINTGTGNITGGNLVLANASTITTGANTNVGYMDGNWQLTAGSRMTATYADLAEYYDADVVYGPGTVLEFGGEKEVTLASDGTARVAGVVSTDPAYAMNAKCPGIATPVALQGRVPTKVRGKIRKGDMMVSAGGGYARPSVTPQMGTVIGKALENFDGVEGVIEVAVGRL